MDSPCKNVGATLTASDADLDADWPAHVVKAYVDLIRSPPYALPLYM